LARRKISFPTASHFGHIKTVYMNMEEARKRSAKNSLRFSTSSEELMKLPARWREDSSLAELLAMLEESQKRERKAVFELNRLRENLDLKDRRSTEQHKKGQKTMKKREKELEKYSKEMQENLRKENQNLRDEVDVLKKHCASLRERVAILLKGQAAKQEGWYSRLNEIEHGVQGLIQSTTNALEKECITLPKPCDPCKKKSAEIARLRSRVTECQEFISGRAEEIFSSAQKEVQFCRTLLGEAKARDEEAISLEAMDGSQEKMLKLRADCEDSVRAARELAEASDKARREQMKSHEESIGTLRGLLEAERTAFEKFRDRMIREREALSEEVNSLRKQIQDEASLDKSERERQESQQKNLQKQVEFLRSELLKSEEAHQRAIQRLSTLEASTLQNSQIMRERCVTEAQRRLETPITGGQVEVLQAALDEHLEDMKALEEDKAWVEKERDAVSEGLEFQQRCVQEQLKAIALLKNSLEIANEERAIFNEDAKLALNEIKESFRNETEQKIQEFRKKAIS